MKTKNILFNLAKIANSLDSKGEFKLASEVDEVMQVAASEDLGEPAEPNMDFVDRLTPREQTRFKKRFEAFKHKGLSSEMATQRALMLTNKELAKELARELSKGEGVEPIDAVGRPAPASAPARKQVERVNLPPALRKRFTPELTDQEMQSALLEKLREKKRKMQDDEVESSELVFSDKDKKRLMLVDEDDNLANDLASFGPDSFEAAIEDPESMQSAETSDKSFKSIFSDNE